MVNVKIVGTKTLNELKVDTPQFQMSVKLDIGCLDLTGVDIGDWLNPPCCMIVNVQLSILEVSILWYISSPFVCIICSIGAH